MTAILGCQKEKKGLDKTFEDANRESRAQDPRLRIINSVPPLLVDVRLTHTGPLLWGRRGGGGVADEERRMGRLGHSLSVLLAPLHWRFAACFYMLHAALPRWAPTIPIHCARHTAPDGDPATSQVRVSPCLLRSSRQSPCRIPLPPPAVCSPCPSSPPGYSVSLSNESVTIGHWTSTPVPAFGPNPDPTAVLDGDPFLRRPFASNIQCKRTNVPFHGFPRVEFLQRRPPSSLLGFNALLPYHCCSDPCPRSHRSALTHIS